MQEIIGYHGTSSAFNTFRFEKNGAHPSKIGVWFASTCDAATTISLAVKRMVDDVPRVVIARLELENPATFQTYTDFLSNFRSAGGSAVKHRAKLKRAGFDGVVILHSDTDSAGERTDYAVFEPHQLKVLDSIRSHSPTAHVDEKRGRLDVRRPRFR